MSKQDGIGTWVWNNTVNFDGILSGSSYDFLFTSLGISFKSIKFDIGSRGSSILYYYTSPPSNVSSINVYASRAGGWVGINYEPPVIYNTIDIKTAPPAEFLTILQANATYQEAKVTDLTGTTWKWNNTIACDNFVVQLDFSSEQQQIYNQLTVSSDSSERFLELYYALTPFVDELAYNNDSGWVVGYQTISITGGTDATNQILIDYLYANATLQGSAPTEPTYKLRVNGKYAQVNGKKKGTLTFEGKTYAWDNSSVIGGEVTPSTGYTVTLNVETPNQTAYHQCYYATNNTGWNQVRQGDEIISTISLQNVTTISFGYNVLGGTPEPGTFCVGTSLGDTDIASLGSEQTKEVKVEANTTYYLSFETMMPGPPDPGDIEIGDVVIE